MSTNTNLTNDIAKKLILGQKVVCPCCNQDMLLPRYKNKNVNTEFKCKSCGEIYHPCKMI